MIKASGVELLAFSQDGNRLWVFSPGGSDYFVSYPGVGIDGNVHVVTDDGNLFEIDTSGNVVSTYPSYFVNPYGSGVSLGRDRSRYYGTHDGFLAIGPDNTEIWQHSAGASAYYSPVIGLYDEIFFIEEHDYSPRCALVTHCFFLRKLDTAGNLVWSFEQPLTEYIGGGVSPSLGADGTLYFGFNSTFYAINPDGSEKWRFDAGDYIFGSPAIGGDGSVYFTADGRLFAVGASNVAYANSPWPRGEGRDNRNTARAVNQHPRGLIDTPSSDITIGVGQSLSFSATILDEYPEDAEILWDFDGQATNSTVEDPGEITFSSIGTYTVSLQVTDSIGLSDPDPPGVVVTVTAELPALIHSDGFE